MFNTGDDLFYLIFSACPPSCKECFLIGSSVVQCSPNGCEIGYTSNPQGDCEGHLVQSDIFM